MSESICACGRPLSDPIHDGLWAQYVAELETALVARADEIRASNPTPAVDVDAIRTRLSNAREEFHHPTPDHVVRIWYEDDILALLDALAAARAALAALREAVEGLRDRAESEVTDAIAGVHYASEVEQSVLLASEEARRYAWETVARLARAALSAAPSETEAGR